MPLKSILQLTTGPTYWSTHESRHLVLRSLEGTYTVREADAEVREPTRGGGQEQVRPLGLCVKEAAPGRK